MKAISQLSGKPTLRCGVLAVIAAFAAHGQTLINLGTQGRNIDFSNAPSTRPVKTGSSLPATCVAGELFFNLAAPAGQNLYSCVATNTWVLIGFGSGLADPGSNGIVVRTAANTTTAVTAPSGAVVGTTDTQTLTNKSINASEVNSGTLSGSRLPAFSGDVSIAAGTTTTTLATVNSTPGTFGDSSHSVQLTVDGKGRITGIAQVVISGGGGGSGGASITSGTLASLPATCTASTLYFATDQPAGQQLYTCSAANTWTQIVSLGPSGALAYNNGSLDIVTSVVPRLTATNTFTGLNAFSNGVQLTTTTVSQPSCASATRGLFWYQNNGSSKDSVQVCVYSGSTFGWTNLY